MDWLAVISNISIRNRLFMQYGITDRLEIDAQTVYQQNYPKGWRLESA